MSSSQEAEKASERGTEQVRVLVVDDHAAVREGVKMILARDREIAVIGESSNGDAAIEMADRRRPDVILMDVRMRGMDGFEATRRITAAHPGMAVILYTAFGERGLLAEGLDCGARGYVLKDAPPDDIVRAVNQVGAAPGDLVAILEALKESGALRAELIVI